MIARMIWTASAAAAVGLNAAYAAEIAGRVTDDARGIGLEGARVEIVELGLETRTTREGNYAFTDLPAGVYTVRAHYLGAETAERSITISAEQKRTLDLKAPGGADRIRVTGQRGALLTALNPQRLSIADVEVVKTKDLSDVVDENAAEMVRRLVGVSVENDQGQGRFAIIRGLDGDLGAVTLDGVRLTSTENADRRTALDVVDSALIERIEVTKTRTPDQDGDVLGGSVDITTQRPFDYDGSQFEVRAEGVYNEIREEWGGEVSFAGSTLLAGEQVGAAGAIVVRDETLGVDTIQAGGAQWVTNQSVLYPEQLQFVNDDISRERIGGTFTVEARPAPYQSFFVHGFFNDTREQLFSTAFSADFGDGAFNDALSDTDASIAVVEGLTSVDRSVTNREEQREVRSIRFGGHTEWAGFRYDYSAFVTRAEERTPNGIDAVFGLTLEDGVLATDTSNRFGPQMVIDQSSAAFYDSDAFAFERLLFTSATNEDDGFAVNFDVTRPTTIFGAPGFLKAGLKGRQREKRRDVTAEAFGATTFDDPLTLTPFLSRSSIDFQLDEIAPGVDPGLLEGFFNANRGAFVTDPVETVIADTASDFESEEDIVAGYMMAEANAHRLSVVAGVRVEDVEFDSQAQQVLEVAAGAPDPDGAFTLAAEANGRRVFTAPIAGRDAYTDILPSINATYQLTDALKLRAAYYRAVARPNFEDVVPSTRFVLDPSGGLIGFAGNADLNRQIADNFDLGAELTVRDSGVFAVTLFRKDIEDFIARQRLQGEAARDVIGFGDPATGVDILTPLNLNDTTINGLEVDYRQAFTFLPGPLDGLVLNVNYTYLDGETTLEGATNGAPSRTVTPPRLSENLYNVILGYDRGPVELRAAVTFRDEFLEVIDGAGQGLDIFVEDQMDLDFSANVRLARGLRLFGALSNIDDEPFTSFIRNADERLLSQFDEFGFTGNLGLSYTY